MKPLQSDPPKAQEIQRLLGARDFQRADALIAEQLKEQPESADALYFRGVSLYFQGQIGQTIEWLKKALAANPQHTDAAVCLSVLLNDIGKYDQAKQVFEQANQSIASQRSSTKTSSMQLEVDRKFAAKHFELADLYLRYRRYDEAIEEFGKAALLDPSSIETRIRRSKAYAKKGFLTRAIQELQQLKREFPRSAVARIQLGLLHYSQGNVLDAELEWEGVLDVEPQNREALGYLEMAKRSRLV
jgi:tetratricopeptide (TPR) repeat protein